MAAESLVDNIEVRLHEVIEAADGTYDFDATIRYELMGMSFLVLVEAKKHKNPIKRELVQVLNQKKQSVGAHKAVMFATAPYQVGAINFAKTHGIALATVSDKSTAFEVRGDGDVLIDGKTGSLAIATINGGASVDVSQLLIGLSA